jgi:hypothetical protein
VTTIVRAFDGARNTPVTFGEDPLELPEDDGGLLPCLGAGVPGASTCSDPLPEPPEPPELPPLDPPDAPPELEL